MQIAIVREFYGLSAIASMYASDNIPLGVDMGWLPNAAVYRPWIWYIVPITSLLVLLSDVIWSRKEKTLIHLLGASGIAFLVMSWFYVIGAILPVIGFFSRTTR